ncbi:MAG: hypothetical protein J6V33_02190 [Bacteroidales bacterium]|nr:hypothetical protein [Bacteroidales bacterium]
MKNKDFETLWSKSRKEADIEPCPLTDDDIKKHIAAAIAEHKEAGHIREAKRKKLYYYIAAAAACVAAIAIGFWKISTDAVPTMPTYDMLQPTQVAQAEVPATMPQTATQQTEIPRPQHTIAHTEPSVADEPEHHGADHDAAVLNTDTVATTYDEPATTPNYQYLAYADIQSYKTDDKAYFCSTNCNAECVVNTFNKTTNYI